MSTVTATLYKRQKDQSVSTWNFMIISESDQFYAIGGDNLKVIAATDRKHLRAIYNSFLRYGYSSKLPTKQQVISDPWESVLPLQEQLLLDSLAA
jgi:hypothetical protein